MSIISSHPWRMRAALVLGGVLTALGLAELSFWLLDIPQTTPFFQEFYGDHYKLMCYDRYGPKDWDIDLHDPVNRTVHGRSLPEPVFSAEWKKTPYAVRVDYNQFGFRDRDFVKKADGVFRIIVAGDSYTYGHGLPERLAWPRQLESLLRQKFPDKQIEVYNFGFYGENLDVLDPLMQYALDEWEPDLLIYGYFLNDPEDDSTPNPVFNRTMDPARKGVAQAPGFLGLGETKMHTLRCLALVERFIQERKLAAATVAWYRSMHQGETWRNAAQRITAVKTLADAKKRRFMIVLLPLILHVNGQYPLTGAHDRVKELARAQGIEFLDVLPCLAKYRDSDLYRHPRDRHPNSLYTRIVAEAVAEAVFPRKEDRAGSGAGRGKALGSAVPAPKPEP